MSTFLENAPTVSVMKKRVQTSLSHVLGIPAPYDWKHASPKDLFRVEKLVSRTREKTQIMGDTLVKEALNPNEHFVSHIQIMDAYFDVLWEQESFREALQSEGLTKEFLHILNRLHDFGRTIFNGSFPLTYIDGVSEGILLKQIPNFPQEYLHTIKWITEEKPLPPENMHLSKAQEIALMLKAIDTLGKLDENGEPRSLDTFFSSQGDYKKWIQTQVSKGRIPFKVLDKRRTKLHESTRLIDADSYEKTDEALTRRGVALMEKKSGLSFEQILDKVKIKLKKPEPNTVPMPVAV